MSLVLNGRTEGMVSEAYQLKVLEAAAELGYTRSAVAMSLRDRRTRTIGLISDEIATSPFAGGMVRAAAAVAAERGYMVLTADLSLPEATAERAVRLFAEREVEGFLYGAMGRTRITAPALPAGVPMVLMNCEEGDQENSAPRDDASLPAVIPDDLDGARRAARRLLEAGHRRVVMLSGDDASVATREREEGFAAELVEAGIGPRIVRTGWQMDDGFRAATELLAEATPPTALFCIRDRVAAGAIHAAAIAGVAVPQDLSVIGYDDEGFFAEALTPPLTTMALPHEEMGRQAMTALLDWIDGGEEVAPVGRVSVPCPLIERGSIAAAPES